MLERLRKISDYLFGSQKAGAPALEQRDEDLAMMQAELCESLHLLTGDKAGMAVVQEINHFLNYAKLVYFEAGFRVGALCRKKGHEVEEIFGLLEGGLQAGGYRGRGRGGR